MMGSIRSMIRFLMHHIEALEDDRDVWVERDPRFRVCSGEVGRVTPKPVGSGSRPFSLVPRELLIDRREWANTHLGGLDHGPRTSLAVAGDPSVPDFRKANTLTLVLREAPSRSPFLTLKDEFDQLVGHFDTVAKAGDVGWPIRALFPH